MPDSSKIPGGNMHESGAVTLDPSEPGVNILPNGKVAVSEQVAAAIHDTYEDRHSDQ